MEIQIVWVDYDQCKVDQFWEDAASMEKDTTFEACPNDNCKWCDYKKICQKPIVPTVKRKLKSRDEIKL